MDKQLKAEIVATVNRAVREAMEVYEERWLTDTQMSEYISVMTKRWLRDHGHMLPRTPIEYTDAQGTRHTTSYLYPLHKIQGMLADGSIKELRHT